MMPPHRRAVLLVAFLCAIAARPLDALPIDVWLSAEQDYGNLFFSNTPGTTAFNEWYIGERPNTLLHSDETEYDVLNGGILWESGPFKRSFGGTSPICCDEIVSIYNRGGALNLDFEIALPGGGTHLGLFSATLGEVVIHGHTDGGYLDLVPLHDGRIDPVSAELLGLPSDHHLAGDLDIYLDFNEHDYGQVDRIARTFGYVDIAVPEPSLLALLPLGLGLALSRRRSGVSR
jgi:hypothetical protein